jgi:hypothetical protein
MAFPTIPTAAAGRILTNVQADTTATRTFPSLTGLTKNSGDLLIAICIAYQSSVTNAAFSGWTAGWTEFIDSSSSTTMAIGAAYKYSTGSETGTISVTQAATITGHAAMILMSIPGAHASTIPVGGSRADGTSAAADSASFDPSTWGTEDTLWIMVGGSGETNTSGAYQGFTTGDPTNYTSNATTGISQDVVGGVEGKVAFRQLNAASEDIPTFAPDTSNARNASMVIAVRPAPTPQQITITPATGTNAALANPFRDTYATEVLADNPLLYWRLGETSGTAEDSSGNSRTGTYSGATQGVTSAIVSTTNRDKAADFDRVDDVVTSTYAPYSGTITLECWIANIDNPSDGAANMVMLGAAAATQFLITTAGFVAFFYAGLSNVLWDNDEGVNFDDGTTHSLAGPHHMVLTFNPSGNGELFINGVSFGTKAAGAYASNNNFQVGRHAATTAAFGGTIDEVAIYSGALSSTRIQAHYNAGKPSGHSINIGAGAETDATQTLSITKTIFKTLTAGTSTSTAQTLSVTKPIFKTLTAATTTNAAQTLTPTKRKTITSGAETDTAQILLKPIRKTLTAVVSTNAAQTLSVTKPIQKTLTAATATNAAQTLTFTKTIRKTITPGAETDAAQTLSITHIHFISVTSSESTAVALDVSIHKYIVQSVATETDAAQAVTFTKTILKTLTPCAETDAAQTLDRDKRLGITTTATTDAAQTLDTFKLIPTSEADTAQGLSYELEQGQEVNITSTNETDAATAQNVDKKVTNTTSSETDSARHLTKKIVKTLTAATETDAAQAVDKDKYISLAASSETDSAQILSVTHIHFRSITTGTETDAAQSVDKDKQVTLIAGAETDAAQTLKIPKLSVATETDEARNLTTTEVNEVDLVAASETDAAQSVTFTKTIFKSLTAAVENGVAQALSVTKTILKALTAAMQPSVATFTESVKKVTITSTSETDGGQTLTVSKPIFKTLTAATETDTSQSLAKVKRIAITAAVISNTANSLRVPKLSVTVETDEAISLSYQGLNEVDITPGAETDTAQSLDVDKTIFVSLTAAASTNTAQTLAITKTIFKSLTNAVETDSSRTLIKPIRKALTAGAESDASTTQTSRKLLILGPGSESGAAILLDPNKHRTLIFATEADTARTLSLQAPIYIIITPGGEIDIATQLPQPQFEPGVTIKDSIGGKISKHKGRVKIRKFGHKLPVISGRIRIK